MTRCSSPPSAEAACSSTSSTPAERSNSTRSTDSATSGNATSLPLRRGEASRQGLRRPRPAPRRHRSSECDRGSRRWRTARQAARDGPADGADQRDSRRPQRQSPAPTGRRRRTRPRRRLSTRRRTASSSATRSSPAQPPAAPHPPTPHGPQPRPVDRRPSIELRHREGTGTVRLPGEYVAEHVELGYAQTSRRPRPHSRPIASSSSTEPATSEASTSPSPEDATTTKPTSPPPRNRLPSTWSPSPSPGTGSTTPLSPAKPS